MSKVGDQYVRAFAEWDRRYRDNPSDFESDMVRIMRGDTPQDYGSICAVYFKELLAATKP